MKIARIEYDVLTLTFVALALPAAGGDTFCNPLNVDYRFSIDNGPQHRTAADK